MRWLANEFIADDIIEHVRKTMLYLEMELSAARAELKQLRGNK